MIPNSSFELPEEGVEIEDVIERDNKEVDTIEFEHDFDEPVIEEWVNSESEEEPSKRYENVPSSSIPKDPSKTNS